MHKDELIQMHTLLCQIKDYVETQQVTEKDEGPFRQYEDLGISPIHVHRSKSDHKKAIFVLGKVLAEYISNSDTSEPARVGNRLNNIVSRMERPAAPKAE